MLLFFIWVFMAACSPGQPATDQTVPTNDLTPAITPTAGPLQVENLHSLCVSSTTTHAEGLSGILPDLLQAMGYQVFQPGGDCDASIEIFMAGEALSDSYQVNQSSQYLTCFTGARFTGEIRLTAPYAIPLVQPILEVDIPPNTIIEYCPDEQNAPYQETWQKALVHGLQQMLGDGALIAALQVPELRDSRLVEGMLGQSPYSETLTGGLIGLLDHADPLTQSTAAMMLSYLRPVPEAAVLAAAQHLGIDPVNSSLWNILQNAGPVAKIVLPQILALLDSSPAGMVNQDAIRAIAEIGPEAGSAAPSLVRVLQDPDSWTRMLAARALGRIMAAPEVALQPLVNLLADTDANVRDAADLSLAQISNHPEMEGSSAETWLQWLQTLANPASFITATP
jgi:hypothetical protein